MTEAGNVARLIKCAPDMCEVLDWFPSTAKLGVLALSCNPSSVLIHKSIRSSGTSFAA